LRTVATLQRSGSSIEGHLTTSRRSASCTMSSRSAGGTPQRRGRGFTWALRWSRNSPSGRSFTASHLLFRDAGATLSPTINCRSLLRQHRRAWRAAVASWGGATGSLATLARRSVGGTRRGSARLHRRGGPRVDLDGEVDEAKLSGKKGRGRASSRARGSTPAGAAPRRARRRARAPPRGAVAPRPPRRTGGGRRRRRSARLSRAR
jgi:hypothetical protein